MGGVDVIISGGSCSGIIGIVGISTSECTVSGPLGCLGKICTKGGIGGGYTEKIAILETAGGTEGGDEMNVDECCGHGGQRGR